MEAIIKKYPVIAILRNLPLDITYDYVKSLIEGGIHCFEVASNTPHVLEQIHFLRETFQSEICIGAGTILTTEMAKDAVDAGAAFLLSPSTDQEVLKYCSANHIPLLPGVFSPADVSICISYGFNTLKLFPANALPKDYIKSLKGPFDDTNYVAVGGVSPENIQTFFDSGFVGVGIGSSLVSKEYLTNKDWTKITEQISTMLSCIQEVK